MGLSQQMVLVATLLIQRAFSVEFIFILEKNKQMCFFERVNKDAEMSLEYQAILGRGNTVGVKVRAPNKQMVYSENRHRDTFTWAATHTGAYSICFSSEEFHSNHELIYFDLMVGDNSAVVGQEGTPKKATTLMEASSFNIHSLLSKASSMQTYFRNREAGGRQFADELNLHVILWSVGETIAVLVIGLGQVLILRSFFSGPSPCSSTAFVNGRVST